jgi:hypothetical protein
MSNEESRSTSSLSEPTSVNSDPSPFASLPVKPLELSLTSEPSTFETLSLQSPQAFSDALSPSDLPSPPATGNTYPSQTDQPAAARQLLTLNLPASPSPQATSPGVAPVSSVALASSPSSSSILLTPSSSLAGMSLSPSRLAGSPSRRRLMRSESKVGLFLFPSVWKAMLCFSIALSKYYFVVDSAEKRNCTSQCRSRCRLAVDSGRSIACHSRLAIAIVIIINNLFIVAIIVIILFVVVKSSVSAPGASDDWCLQPVQSRARAASGVGQASARTQVT